MARRRADACYRELGAELRKRRIAANLTMRELAYHLDWSPSTVSRVESGYIGLPTAEVLRGEVPTTIAAVTSIVLRDEHGASTCPPVSVLLESSSRGERAAHHRWIRRLPRRFGADRVVVSPADQAFLDG